MAKAHDATLETGRARGSVAEVFLAALRLGLSSFGGPIAHLAYFERTYVRERGWLSAEEYAGIVAVCQLLPGPTSSQVGFLIGRRRAGWPGALAAWAGFTVPSAVLMYAFAWLAPHAAGAWMRAVLHGLLLTAVAVVAQAVWNMARTLCPDRQRIGLALLAAALLAWHASTGMQMLAMLAGAVGGWLLCTKLTAPVGHPSLRISPPVAWTAIALYCVLLLLAFSVPPASAHDAWALGADFYRAGALVFGGGHVVLPLLRQALVGGSWVSDDGFLAGYGLAQGLPGPLFTIAAYLGAISAPAGSSAGWAAMALAAIFLPGLLLASASQALWSRFAQAQVAQRILAGVNAAVVGILAAALYNPVLVSAVHSAADAAIAVGCFILLTRWRVPPVVIVVLCVLLSELRVLR